MIKRPQRGEEPVQQPTCENCIHAIRVRHQQEKVLCIQELEEFPANSSEVCELHGLKKQEA